MSQESPLVQRVLYFRLTASDWKSIHGEWGATGGSGGVHITLDKIDPDSATSQFLGTTVEPVTIPGVVAVGTQASAPLTLKNWSSKRNQWSIADQKSSRHPAIDSENGLPDFDDARLWNGAGRASTDWENKVVVYLAKASDDRYYMGFVVGGTPPTGWPAELAPMFTSPDRIGLVDFGDGSSTQDKLVGAVLRTLRSHHNVLLYGPPGAGKTRAMTVLKGGFEEPSTLRYLTIDPSDAGSPFQQEAAGELPMPEPVFVDWSTFHQRTTYEEFVVGLRPVPGDGGGITLRPRAGRFLEAIHAIENGKYESAVLLIDEVNRADAAAVLGELITFLEVDKRGLEFYPTYLSADPDTPGYTEEVDFRDGPGRLAFPVRVPKTLYVIGTMNALDRSIAPLDQALARRFYRVEATPDMELLRQKLGASKDRPAPQALLADDGAGTTAYHLLDRVNRFVRHSVGRDAQFGHGYLVKVWEADGDEERWSRLADAWDHSLFPQLEEFYRARPQLLSALVRGTGDGLPPWYPYQAEPPPPALDDEFDDAGVLLYSPDAVSALAPERRREALVILALGDGTATKPPAQAGPTDGSDDDDGEA